jgi:ethanolamine utilization protein EutQ (cupin superfamily)
MKMDEYLLDFKNLAWERPAPGLRYKACVRDNQRIRLVEFSEGFFEENWCTNGHIGYVLEGSISIDFNGNVRAFSAGDGIFIPEGEQSKHKGKVTKGEKALLILFENV